MALTLRTEWENNKALSLAGQRLGLNLLNLTFGFSFVSERTTDTEQTYCILNVSPPNDIGIKQASQLSPQEVFGDVKVSSLNGPMDNQTVHKTTYLPIQVQYHPNISARHKLNKNLVGVRSVNGITQ